MDDYKVADVYSQNAEDYATKFFQPWRANSEVYTVVKTLLGHDNFTNTSLAGKRILDLACGGGNYLQHFLQLGAERVVGVDISSGLVDTAITLTKEAGFSTDRFAFYHADCSNVEEVLESIKDEDVKEFDIVTGAWLLCNASSLEVLRNMAEVGSRLTKSGGVFMNILVNPESFHNPPENFEPARQYGLVFERCGELDSIPIRKVTFLDPLGTYMFDVYNYCYTYEQLREALQEHGFPTTNVVTIQLAPHFADKLNSNFREFLQNPREAHMVCLESKKLN